MYICDVSQGKHRPLVEACAQGHMGLVKALLKRKADLDAVGMVHTHAHTSIHVCCKIHYPVL